MHGWLLILRPPVCCSISLRANLLLLFLTSTMGHTGVVVLPALSTKTQRSCYGGVGSSEKPET